MDLPYDKGGNIQTRHHMVPNKTTQMDYHFWIASQKCSIFPINIISNYLYNLLPYIGRRSDPIVENTTYSCHWMSLNINKLSWCSTWNSTLTLLTFNMMENTHSNTNLVDGSWRPSDPALSMTFSLP